VMTEEYQGGSTTTLVIHHAEQDDRGTYTLEAINRNGKEKVDLDLIVLDKDHHDCAMYAKGNKQCSCTHSYTGPDETMKKLMDLQYNDSHMF